MPGRSGAAVAAFRINEDCLEGSVVQTSSQSPSSSTRRLRRKRTGTSNPISESHTNLEEAASPTHVQSADEVVVTVDTNHQTAGPTEMSNISTSAADNAAGPAAADDAAGPSALGSGPPMQQSNMVPRTYSVPPGIWSSQGSDETKAITTRESLNSADSNALSLSGSSDSGQMFSARKRQIRRIMTNPRFDALIGSIIFANCFTISLEQSWDLEGRDTTVLQWLEHGYLSVYTIELAIRFFAFSWTCLYDHWVQFDLFLVVAGIISTWMVQPFAGEVDQLGPLMVLRTARLMRLARTVRLLIKFRELWMLIRGLLNSASTMLYTLLTLFVVIYIFSCMSIELITNHSLARGPNADPDFQKFVKAHFASLPLTMITLMQFASLDNMSLLYMPLVKKSWWLAFFFILIILVVSIVLMNLITAVVVNSALEQAMQDKEAMKAQEDKRRKKMMKDLKKMFKALDDDNSGQVSKEEMSLMNDDHKTLLYNILGMSDPLEVFKQLDVDQSGLLEIDEFCDGIWQVAISKAPIELKRLEKQVNNLKHMLTESVSVQNTVQETLDTILSSINAQGRALRDMNDETISESAKGARVQMRAAEHRSMSTTSVAREPLPDGNGLAMLQDNLSSDIHRLRDLMTQQLQGISDQLQQVLSGPPAWGPASSKPRIISLGEEVTTHLGASNQFAHDSMVCWIESLRLQLLNAAESIQVTMSAIPGKCPQRNMSAILGKCPFRNSQDLFESRVFIPDHWNTQKKPQVPAEPPPLKFCCEEMRDPSEQSGGDQNSVGASTML